MSKKKSTSASELSLLSSKVNLVSAVLAAIENMPVETRPWNVAGKKTELVADLAGDMILHHGSVEGWKHPLDCPTAQTGKFCTGCGKRKQ